MARKRAGQATHATSHYDAVDFKIMEVEEYLPDNTTNTPDIVYYTMVLMPGKMMLKMKLRDDVDPGFAKREIVHAIRVKMLELRDPNYQYSWEKE